MQAFPLFSCIIRLAALHIPGPEIKVKRYTGKHQAHTNQGFARTCQDGVAEQSNAEKNDNGRYNRITPNFIRTMRIGHLSAKYENAQCGCAVINEYGKDDHVGKLVECTGEYKQAGPNAL